MFLDDPRGSSAVLESKFVSNEDWQNQVLQIIKRKMKNLGQLERSTVGEIKKTIELKYEIDELRKYDDKKAKELIAFYDGLI